MKHPFLVALVVTALFSLAEAIPGVVSTSFARTAPDPQDNRLNFYRAKRLLKTRIYASPDERVAFYSGCKFHFARGQEQRFATLEPDLDSCGYQVRKRKFRARRIEWEHVVPASWFGRDRSCWAHGGRKNCRRYDKWFRLAEADMHNLVPAIGELNADRSNYRFGEIDGEERRYGAVDFEVDRSRRVVEPRPEVRGDIARIAWYMRDTWGVSFSREQMRLFEQWNEADAVSAWECERNRRIKAIQGNGNPYVERDCQ